MNIGLFFGSFNPIHTGHLMIAQYMLNETEIYKVKFIVSPQNPLKENKDLMPAEFRLQMVNISIADNKEFEIEDIEFSLPTPSYTIDTLNALSIKYPNDTLYIIMGSDSLAQIERWRDYEKILTYNILIYKRDKNFTNPYSKNKNITVFDCPILNISATKIREMLAQNKSIQYMVNNEIIDSLKSFYLKN